MDQVIYIKYLWRIEDIAVAVKYHIKTTTGFRILILISRLFGAIEICKFLFKYVVSINFDLGALFSVAWIIFFLSTNKILIYSFIYSCKKTNHKNKQIEWEINKDKIVHRMINLSESTFTWDLIKGILDTPDGFMLYLQQNMFYWLPKKEFSNEEDVAQFAFIAQDKVKRFQQIK